MLEAAPPLDPSHADARMRRNLRLMPWWWIFRWVWLGEAIWVIYLLEDRSFTLGQVFLLTAIYYAVVIAAEAPTGMFADRFGRRLSLIIGGVITCAAFVAFGLGGTFTLLAVSWAMFAVADAFYSGADSALLFDSLHRLGRDADFARWMGRLMALIAVSIAGFTLVGSLMIRWTPLPVPIVLSGLLSLPSIALAFAMTEPPRETERTPFLVTGRESLGRIASSRALWSITLLMALVTLSIVLMSTVLQPVVAGYGVPLWTLGIFVAAQMLLSAAGGWLASPVRRWLGLAGTLRAMALLTTLAIFAGASGVLWLFPLFIAPSVGWNVMYPHVVDYVSRRVPEHQRATSISITNLAGSLISIPAVLVLGAIVDAWALGPMLAIAGAALTAAAIAIYFAWARAGDTALEPPPGSPPLDPPLEDPPLEDRTATLAP